MIVKERPTVRALAFIHNRYLKCGKEQKKNRRNGFVVALSSYGVPPTKRKNGFIFSNDYAKRSRSRDGIYLGDVFSAEGKL